MEELVRIRIDELNSLKDELIEKQKKDLAKIEVRIEELSGLLGNGTYIKKEPEIRPTVTSTPKVVENIMTDIKSAVPEIQEEHTISKDELESILATDINDIKEEDEIIAAAENIEPEIIEPVKFEETMTAKEPPAIKTEEKKSTKKDAELPAEKDEIAEAPVKEVPVKVAEKATTTKAEAKATKPAAAASKTAAADAKASQDDIEAILNALD
ncbi:MAG: hypothetical protein PHV30_07525 [Candidatus Margulisbacteria bacterium]|nr:hypothetical protein [Candidatus Margulisiibacteriota bacterium]